MIVNNTLASDLWCGLTVEGTFEKCYFENKRIAAINDTLQATIWHDSQWTNANKKILPFEDVVSLTTIFNKIL